MFTGCDKTKSSTIVLRGGAAQYLEETHRSLNDAIMIVRRAYKSKAIVAGGGAIEMELSRYLREYLRGIEGKEQLVINGFAKALETIPRTLAENSGMNSTDVLNKLRQKHAQGGEDGKHFGVNVLDGNVDDMYEKFVWEPEEVRINVLQAASEAACAILSVDRTIRNPKSEQAKAEAAKRLDFNNPQAQRGVGRGGRGRGRGMDMRGLKTMRGRGGK